jgi:hypothetical protein
MRDTQEKYLRNKGITTSNLENLEAPQPTTTFQEERRVFNFGLMVTGLS